MATNASSSETIETTTIQIDKSALVNLIQEDIKYIKEAIEKLEKYKKQVIQQADEALEKFKMIKDVGSLKELQELMKTVTKLKLQISSKFRIRSEENNPNRNNRSNDSANGNRFIPEDLLKHLPQLHKNPVFEKSSDFQSFHRLFNDLTTELKLCLLCFSIFPENAVIKKRLMVYWWIGEGFVHPSSDGKTAEEVGKEFFYKLIEKGFIEPVYKDRERLGVSYCKMHRFIRSALRILADKAKFLDFDDKGVPIEEFSGSYRASLMGRGLTNIQDLEKLHTLFNVNEGILEFTLEWFLKMRNVNLLYLGRWQTSGTHHIEVEETKFLDGLEGMIHLRLLSLQGVSRIIGLPKSISRLINLKILDLRACHNLEAIPKGIGYLKSLTHLDVSECYLIDHMPIELSLLLELEVFKGFHVGGKNSCTLDNLAKLPKLRKLSIITGVKNFPTEAQLHALQQFQMLQKLTISWGGGASQNTAAEPSKPSDKKEGVMASNFSKLEKLDIQCFPSTFTPNWLIPAKLKGLKKLYIRGGDFSDLGPFQAMENREEGKVSKWRVEVLRLKYLNKLEMDWREMLQLFPYLIYLEKVNCPKLTFFPCDGSGVWMNKA